MLYVLHSDLVVLHHILTVRAPCLMSSSGYWIDQKLPLPDDCADHPTSVCLCVSMKASFFFFF